MQVVPAQSSRTGASQLPEPRHWPGFLLHPCTKAPGAPSPVPQMRSPTERTSLQNPSPQEHRCAQQETQGSIFLCWQVASCNVGWISFF